ncbi:GOLPH3/VPS74 family protein [Marinactinospora rubrisoli]|uniref:GPP34 family phosphoprotein n=1 Tax=Marinactinospora rubrisoli TaxID=2715399 RepID=A0ABW2KB09_9ACTN
MSDPLIAEELLLLAYHPDTGRPLATDTRLTAGLAGALLAELALTGRVAIERDRVHAAGASQPGGHPELDLLAAEIARQRRPARVRSWVSRTGSLRLRRALQESAVQRRLLNRERVTVLRVFHREDYRPADPSTRAELLDRLRAMLMGGRAPDPRSTALLGILGATRLDRRLFADLPARERRRRMKRLLADDRIGRAVLAVIKSVEYVGGGGDGDGGGGE